MKSREREISKLCNDYPDLERLGVERFSERQRTRKQSRDMKQEMRRIERLIPFQKGKDKILIVGCGPYPHTMKELLGLGHDVMALEVRKPFVQSAIEFLGDSTRVQHGSVEEMPYDKETFKLVFMESLLEHVDSTDKALAEGFRVLEKGGVLNILTTNRLRFSLTGNNGEFNVPFYNWFPAIMKESFVFHHLHCQPKLANFSSRPAVHWFTFSGLCMLGRRAGFSKFYSSIDLEDAEDKSIRVNRIKRFLLHLIQRNPVLRSVVLVLTHFGGNIYMLKRQE